MIEIFNADFKNENNYQNIDFIEQQYYVFESLINRTMKNDYEIKNNDFEYSFLDNQSKMSSYNNDHNNNDYEYLTNDNQLQSFARLRLISITNYNKLVTIMKTILTTTITNIHF